MSQESEMSVIKEEINTVKNNFDMLMDELSSFVDTNFPPLDRERTETDDCEEDDENVVEDKRMLSLKDMLKGLMNQTYSNPDDPYFEFDPDKVWSPYIGTLIRAGIAKRHPNDANRFKLVEFHL